MELVSSFIHKIVSIESLSVFLGGPRQALHLTARENTPEDVAHRWRRNVDQRGIQPGPSSLVNSVLQSSMKNEMLTRETTLFLTE